jgi:hypothetical protein
MVDRFDAAAGPLDAVQKIPLMIPFTESRLAGPAQKRHVCSKA